MSGYERAPIALGRPQARAGLCGSIPPVTRSPCSPKCLRGDGSVISAWSSSHRIRAPRSAGSPPPGRAPPPPRSSTRWCVESVREGYLLHYGEPRILAGADHDLGLLAGDYLYALGLERLAALGDLDAVRELSDLISLAASSTTASARPARAEREAQALWLAVATAIAVRRRRALRGGESALRSGPATPRRCFARRPRAPPVPASAASD